MRLNNYTCLRQQTYFIRSTYTMMLDGESTSARNVELFRWYSFIEIHQALITPHTRNTTITQGMLSNKFSRRQFLRLSQTDHSWLRFHSVGFLSQQMQLVHYPWMIFYQYSSLVCRCFKSMVIGIMYSKLNRRARYGYIYIIPNNKNA